MKNNSPGGCDSCCGCKSLILGIDAADRWDLVQGIDFGFINFNFQDRLPLWSQPLGGSGVALHKRRIPTSETVRLVIRPSAVVRADNTPDEGIRVQGDYLFFANDDATEHWRVRVENERLQTETHARQQIIKQTITTVSPDGDETVETHYAGTMQLNEICIEVRGENVSIWLASVATQSGRSTVQTPRGHVERYQHWLVFAQDIPPDERPGNRWGIKQETVTDQYQQAPVVQAELVTASATAVVDGETTENNQRGGILCDQCYLFSKRLKITIEHIPDPQSFTLFQIGQWIGQGAMNGEYIIDRPGSHYYGQDSAPCGLPALTNLTFEFQQVPHSAPPFTRTITMPPLSHHWGPPTLSAAGELELVKNINVIQRQSWRWTFEDAPFNSFGEHLVPTDDPLKVIAAVNAQHTRSAPDPFFLRSGLFTFELIN